MTVEQKVFSTRVLAWFDRWGRKGLPWQKDTSAYRVWVSEIMLQQTQVTTVIPYFNRFMESFPNVHSLAAASEDEVLSHWSGLGYYARGRNLHRAARTVIAEHDGVFPTDMVSLQALPGIGRSTAAAIVSISGAGAEPILDGNVKRVLSRYYAIEGWPGQLSVQRKLWEVAEQLMPDHGVREYTQAMMDLGATVCTRSRPACDRCPVADDCEARAQGIPTEFPHPKPKKARPHRQRRFLLLTDDTGSLLLERRPSKGLWGGLWSLPEFEVNDDWLAILASQGFNVAETDELPMLRHAFSHYELDILPVIVRVTAAAIKERKMASEQAVWYNTAQSLPGGVPAPVAILIEQFRAEQVARSETQ